MPTPLPIPTSPPAISSPQPLLIPHPSPERPPEILRPATAPPILQRFNDPGEGDLCPQDDLGTLPGMYHGLRAHGTSPPSPPSPVPFSPSSPPTRPPSSPSSPLLLPPLLKPSPFLQLPAHLSLPQRDLLHTLSPILILPSPSPAQSPLSPSSPLFLPLLLEPSLSPQLLVHLSSPPCDLLHTLSLSPSVPVLVMSSLPCSRFDCQSLVPTPLPFSQLPAHLLPLPCDLAPTPSLAPLLPLDCVLAAPRDILPPLAFPPSPPPRPPDPDSSPMQSPSLLPVHAMATSPPSPHFLPSTLLLQHLSGSRSSLHYPPLLIIPPSLPPDPPDSTPASTARHQPLPPSPLVSSPTEATNAMATHHEEHRSKQPMDVFKPQN
jgi:hypothetical protein